MKTTTTFRQSEHTRSACSAAEFAWNPQCYNNAGIARQFRCCWSRRQQFVIN